MNRFDYNIPIATKSSAAGIGTIGWRSSATAAKLKLHALAHDIAAAAQRGGPEVAQVARRAAAALA